MKRTRSIVGILAGFLIFCEITRGLNFLYVSDNDSEYERFVWNDFYESKGEIDNLYLGSSHVYCDINPFMLDQLNGEYNFNMATPGQLMNGTYYLLKEAVRNNEISHVYIELYYYFNVNENFNCYEEPVNTDAFRNWNNLEYMQPSFNKLVYFWKTTDVEEYSNVFFRFSKYRSKIDDWDYVKNNIFQKTSNKSEIGELKKGYFPMNMVYKEKERIFEQGRILEMQPIAETSERYLRKSISYCQKREIPVTLFVSPIYELQLISTENYDNYINQIRLIADEYDIDFYDFNLTKEEYLPIQQVEFYYDEGHLNPTGADVFTEFFYQVMSGNTLENSEYFYDTYKQKLQNQEPTVYGIYYRKERNPQDDEQIIRNMWVASNREEGMEYRIVLAPEEREQYILQDFNENRQFAIGADEHGTCTVTYRRKGMSDLEQTIEIEY